MDPVIVYDAYFKFVNVKIIIHMCHCMRHHMRHHCVTILSSYVSIRPKLVCVSRNISLLCVTYPAVAMQISRAYPRKAIIFYSLSVRSNKRAVAFVFSFANVTTHFSPFISKCKYLNLDKRPSSYIRGWEKIPSQSITRWRVDAETIDRLIVMV